MSTATRGHSQAASTMRPVLRVASALAALVACQVGAAPAARQPTVEAVLLRAVQAERAVDLRGTEVVVAASPQDATPRTESRRVVWTRTGLSRLSYTDPASERGVVKVDDGTWMKSYDPWRNAVMIARSMPRAADRRSAMRLVRLVLRNYQVRIERREPIAGRQCYRVSLEPRSRYGYPVILWIDVHTGVVLSRHESDRRNTIGLVVFTSVEYPRRVAASEARYRFPSRAQRVTISMSPLYREVGPLRRRSSFPITLPLVVPGGYEFEACEMVRVAGQPTACLRYTDGLVNLTVFQSGPRAPRPPSGYSLRWKSLARGDAVVACSTRDLDVLVMGHAAVPCLVAVARSLSPRRERAAAAYLGRAFGLAPASFGYLRDRGLGVDTISALLTISRRTGQRLHRLLERYREGSDWESLARAAGASRREVVLQVRTVRDALR